MPANKKYLIKSPWIRFSKLLAAILGGFMLSIAIHMVLGLWIDLHLVLVTSVFSVFIIWTVLMLAVYWIKSPLKAWVVILITLIICGAAIYLGKMNM